MSRELISRAAALIRQADGLLITAGAGMGVDSGLPDFRSSNGFWKAYPALERANIEFESIANPASFRRDARQAWGFYGHRLNLYRQTVPHPGFALLKKMGEQLQHGVFIHTSNVDGQFQKAGFDEGRVSEIHGSIHHLQCVKESCSSAIWSADTFHPEINHDECRLLNDLPVCPSCGSLARPNILMFGDWAWRPDRARKQGAGLSGWLRSVIRPVVIEIGAGSEISTVRRFGERFPNLIRINPREFQVHRDDAVGIAMGGLDALEMLHIELMGWGRDVAARVTAYR